MKMYAYTYVYVGVIHLWSPKFHFILGGRRGVVGRLVFMSGSVFKVKEKLDLNFFLDGISD